MHGKNVSDFAEILKNLIGYIDLKITLLGPRNTYVGYLK